MDPVFSIGISSLWDELRHMPTGGVWWVNTDRSEDAISLANQTIAFQTGTAKVAAMSMGSDPGKVFKLDETQGPEKNSVIFDARFREGTILYVPRYTLLS